MSNVNYRSQFDYSYCGQRVSLLAKVSIAAAGAPTIASKTGMGIASMVRTAAGAYTITLTQAYAVLLGVRVSDLSGSSAPAAPIMNIISDSVSSNPSTVSIQFRNLSGTATDPASGEVLYIEIELDRSSVGH